MARTRLLAIDKGNTRGKAAVFTETNETFRFDFTDAQSLLEWFLPLQPTHAIYCNVGAKDEVFEQMVSRKVSMLQLNHSANFPFQNKYQTPQTLGMDRAAAVAGAIEIFPNTNCLVIDVGTCITYDFVTAEKNYLGGAIAPGLQMRLQAMHEFTAKLPNVKAKLPETFIGNTTETSMLSGAFYGVLAEINGTIERYEEQFGNLQVLICGGDAHLFDKRTKKSIFVAPDLVLTGLKNIATINI